MTYLDWPELKPDLSLDYGLPVPRIKHHQENHPKDIKGYVGDEHVLLILLLLQS